MPYLYDVFRFISIGILYHGIMVYITENII